MPGRTETSSAPAESLGVLPESYVLHDAFVMDPAGEFTGPQDIEVQAGVISRIGRNISSEFPGFDLQGVWVMPGVIDCHAHVTMQTLDTLRLLRRPISRWALDAAQTCERLLSAGVTFVRDAGGADPGLRDAIADGVCRGPGLEVSILMLSRVGGHGDGYLPAIDYEMSTAYLVPNYPGRGNPIIDGPDDMRRRVRGLLRAGADWIKLCATGGISSDFDDPLDPEFSEEELRVAVGEAGLRRRSVMAHAYGGPGLDDAIRAGVRSIEHGTLMSEEQAAAMGAAGCWLVPTLGALQDDVAQADAGALPPSIAAKARQMRSALADIVGLATAHGVRIAVGSDAIETRRQGEALKEIWWLGRAGLSPADALVAATGAGAELCGVASSHGRLAAGMRADILLLDEDPSDLRVFAEPDPVSGVIQAGRVVRQHERLAVASG